MVPYPCPIPAALLKGPPAAQALLRGDGAHPRLRGEALFYPFGAGTLLLVRILGLPRDGFFALHIHQQGDCRTGGDLPFHRAGGHYNPGGLPHPDHAGDLPVILSSGGRALALFYTGRFRPGQVVGRSMVLHDGPDDYRTQPAGDSGPPIACGAISAIAR